MNLYLFVCMYIGRVCFSGMNVCRVCMYACMYSMVCYSMYGCMCVDYVCITCIYGMHVCRLYMMGMNVGFVCCVSTYGMYVGHAFMYVCMFGICIYICMYVGYVCMVCMYIFHARIRCVAWAKVLIGGCGGCPPATYRAALSWIE